MSAAYWCVLIVGALPYLLVFLTGIPSRNSASRWGKAYDNHNPRAAADKLTGWRKRAYQAQLNSYESFAPFAVAVIMAQAQRGAMFTIDIIAVTYVALRLVYCTFFLANLATARSTAWFIAMGRIVTLFAVAAGLIP
jgi:uncharacterized MAPEG superfamily protein